MEAITCGNDQYSLVAEPSLPCNDDAVKNITESFSRGTLEADTVVPIPNQNLTAVWLHDADLKKIHIHDTKSYLDKYFYPTEIFNNQAEFFNYLERLETTSKTYFVFSSKMAEHLCKVVSKRSEHYKVYQLQFPKDPSKVKQEMDELFGQIYQDMKIDIKYMSSITAVIKQTTETKEQSKASQFCPCPIPYLEKPAAFKKPARPTSSSSRPFLSNEELQSCLSIYFNQGLIHHRNHQYIEARNSYLQALREPTGSTDEYAAINHRLGHVCHTQGEHKQAHDYYLKAVELAADTVSAKEYKRDLKEIKDLLEHLNRERHSGSLRMTGVSNLNFNGLWTKILADVQDIYRTQHIIQLNNYNYMRLYGYIYDYCTTGQYIVSGELYNALKDLLESNATNILNEGLHLQGCDLLRVYATNWEKYRFSSKVTNRACAYLNRHWVQREYDSGRRNVYEFFNLAIKIWKKHVLKPLNAHLTQTCLRLIEAERNSIFINTTFISKFIQNLVALGSNVDHLVINNHNQRTSSNLDVYKNNFETDFLQETEQFYIYEITALLKNKTMIEYLKKGAERIEEEKHRALSYLHSSTVQPLVYIVEQIFINQPEEWRIRGEIIFIYAEAETFLLNEKFQVLALLYKLVKRIENGIVDLQTIFENYLHQDAYNTIENNPTSFVEIFFGIYTKSFKLVQEVFNSDQNFIHAIYKAYKRLMKDIKAVGVFSNASQLLAQYCISILPKQNETVEKIEFEKRLNIIIFILKCQENEDALKEFCTSLKELLSNQSNISITYVKTMISKLEEVCDIEQASILRAKVIYRNNVTDDSGAIDVLIVNDEQQVLLRKKDLQIHYYQIRKLLRDKNYQDLPPLCELISQQPNGPFYLKKLVQEFIHQMGIDITGNILNNRIREPFYKVYIEGLLNFHEAGLQIITTAFGIQHNFIDAFKDSFTNVINYNPVTRTVGNIDEFLAQYFDSFLKKGIETVEQRDIEKQSNDCKILLKYVDDIDGFKKSYEFYLENRLFDQSSISPDLEKLIISNLEEVCGILYRSQLQEKADRIKRESDNNMNINVSISFEFFSSK